MKSANITCDNLPYNCREKFEKEYIVPVIVLFRFAKTIMRREFMLAHNQEF